MARSMTRSFDGRSIERAIAEDLSPNDFTPKIHLPMLAAIAQGSGFPNLSRLGLLADRILAAYEAYAAVVPPGIECQVPLV